VGDSLRVLTWNVLYETSSTGGPGGERWPLTVELLRDAGPDLAALQEVLPGRVAALERDLPQYRLAVSEPGGSGRADGLLGAVAAVAFVLLVLRLLHRRRAADPRPPGRLRRLAGVAITLGLAVLALGIPAAIGLASWYVGGFDRINEQLVFLYRPERMTLVDQRTFWFSPTPDRPGSRFFFEFEPRLGHLATFVLAPGGDTLTAVTVHPGHSPFTQEYGGRLVRRYADARWTGAPQVVLGDFNATPGGARMSAVAAAGRGDVPPFRDAWLEAGERAGPDVTFHGLRAARAGSIAAAAGIVARPGGLRIDYVLLRGPLRARRVEVRGAGRGGIVASDHDAVIADLVLDDTRRARTPARE
jgi:endonuclease/exonuclease/phosphatase family metal-dependent hydrolase